MGKVNFLVVMEREEEGYGGSIEEKRGVSIVGEWMIGGRG
jgi:hypothetical protein